MRRPNQTTVITLVFTVLLKLSEQLLHDQPWWQKHLSWLFTVCAALFVGMLVDALMTEDSWLRENLRALTRVFVVETIARAHRANEQRGEWKEITIHLHFPRVARRITVTISVDSVTNLPQARRLFVLHSDFLDRVAKNERKTFVIAMIPLARRDGAQGLMCWGNQYREPGDVAGMFPLSAGTENTVIVEASTGAWVRQRERIFLAVLGDYDGRVFLAYKGSPATLKVVGD